VEVVVWYCLAERRTWSRAFLLASCFLLSAFCFLLASCLLRPRRVVIRQRGLGIGRWLGANQLTLTTVGQGFNFKSSLSALPLNLEPTTTNKTLTVEAHHGLCYSNSYSLLLLLLLSSGPNYLH
jgi:hypothetical protein